MISGDEPPASSIHRDEVDGVPVFWSSAPGPLRAALTFRVGQADEDLPRHGICHLVEHLVLSRTESAPHAYNGSTGTVLTNYVVAGTEDQVTDYLAAVCAGLADLPTERLDHERRIIRSEAAERAGGVVRSLTALRWGPVGPGLVAYPEFALEHVTDQEVHAWSATHFVRERAALWLSGPPPAALRLPLPCGAPASPLVVQAAAPTPFSYVYSDRGFGASLLARRGAAGAALGYLAQRRLQDRLRHELGLVYGVSGTLDRLPDGVRHLCFLAECLPENAAAVQEQVATVLADLPRRPPTEAELRDLRESVGSADDDPLSVLGELDQLCTQVLLGDPLVTRAEFTLDVAGLTPEAVREEAAAALKTLVLAVPNAAAVPPSLAEPVGSGSDHVVRPVVALRPRPTRTTDKTLHLSAEGVTIRTAGDQPVTVMFDRCAAALSYPDDVRVLYGEDGFILHVDAHQWFGGVDAIRRMDQSIPEQRRVPLAEPRVTAEERKAHQAEERQHKRAIAGWFALAVFLLIGFFPAAAWPVIRSFQASRRSGYWWRHLVVAYSVLGAAWIAAIIWIGQSSP